MSITSEEPEPSADASSSPPGSGVSRRGLVVGGAAAAGIALAATSGSSAAFATGRGHQGSVADAPRLPAGFTKTFTDKFVTANGIRQHVVIGGNGPPLLLVHGWPENWYAWRFMMPALAKKYTVVAVDQRGIGLTDKPASGYDAGTLANDLAALMTKLGYARFSVVGHDTGYVISYALAADHRNRVDRLVVAEIPGPPGVGENPYGPPYFVPEHDNNRLWHIAFNRVNDELIINMVKSNANEYYRYEFAVQGGGQTLPDYAIRYYIGLYTRNRGILRATFGLYRAWSETLEQNIVRSGVPLTIPVLGIGGENSWGLAAGGGLAPAAPGVQSVSIPGVGHWVAEQAPVEMVELITTFLA
ncbi:MAG: alpha/beta hydrolase [Mycetocola sp.]